MPRRLLVLAFLCALGATADAAEPLRLATLFGDHMVVQRDMPLPVWGWDTAGQRVRVRLAGKTAAATAGADGRWRAVLPALAAGGPHTLVVEGSTKLSVHDVLVGEVWFCSGQSNMAFLVRSSRDARHDIPRARDDKIRHVALPRKPQSSPVDDVPTTWQVCAPDTVGGFSACAYYMAQALRAALHVPVGVVNASWGGTRIEPWTAPEGFRAVPALHHLADEIEQAAGKPPGSHQQAGVLYCGMVHPCVGFAMRGAVWYQGESNHRDGALYTDKMKALINGWRSVWGLGDFPFYFVQIAPFRYGTEPVGVLPTFWEAQAAVVDAVPNTGMVVINDVATIGNIHPPDKRTVGGRLARMALARTYGKDVVATGPVFDKLTVEGSALRVTFTETAGGLRTRDGKPPDFFQIAGADTGFRPARATIEKDAVVLTAEGVASPLAMRFAWHKEAEPKLVNGAGLPASAFRAGSIPRPDFLPKIAEASAYRLVYDLDLARLGPLPVYTVDASKETTPGFTRIAYLLELGGDGGPARYVWVSMRAFTEDPNLIGVPTAVSGARFQQAVEAMRVESNVKGLAVGTDLTGWLEFWPSNYGPANAAGVAGASDKVWDWGDEPSGPALGYGSMQVHDPKAGQTVFALNHWTAGASADVGIGNSELDPRARDWTFARNAGALEFKRLRVFVLPK